MSNQKERGGATLSQSDLPKWLPSTNYTTQIFLFIGSIFSFFTFTEAEVGAVVASLYSVIGFLAAIREKAKTGIKIGWKEWLLNPNTFVYLGVILTAFLPNIAPQITKELETVVRGLLNGNWQQVLTATLSLLSFIFFQLRGKVGAKVLPIVVLALFCTTANAQTNRSLKRGYTANLKELQKDTFDILPQPWEYPSDVTTGVSKRDGTRVLVSNWGADALRLNELRGRIIAECKKPVHIRIVDTGFDTDHTQLTAGKRTGANYTTDPNGVDINGHATHCTGIIFAQDFGICYDLAKLGIVTWEMNKILSNTGSGSFAWFETCEKAQRAKDELRKAAGTRTIVSASFGGSTPALTGVEAAMKANTALGTVYIVAAGNTGTTGVQYPAHSQYAIACASLDQSLTRSSYSTMGAQVWAAQAGRGIQSTWPNNKFATLSGTSMATPFLAGCTAIALSKWGDLLPDYNAVKSYIATISQDIAPTGKDDATGYGFSLIQKILDTKPNGTTPPPPPPIDTIPVRELRTLSFVFTGKYPMYWSAAGSTVNRVTKPHVFKVGKAKAQALNLLTVNRIEVSVNSTTTANVQEAQILDALNTLVFSGGRGLGLPSNSDYADAAYWSAYFTELLVYSQYKHKINLVVTRIEATDGKNNIVFTGGQLKHVPK
jgi:subtilisin